MKYSEDLVNNYATRIRKTSIYNHVLYKEF